MFFAACRISDKFIHFALPLCAGPAQPPCTIRASNPTAIRSYFSPAPSRKRLKSQYHTHIQAYAQDCKVVSAQILQSCILEPRQARAA